MKRPAGLSLLFLALFVLPACGMRSNDGAVGGETGNLAFQISWSHAIPTGVQPAPPAGADVCTYYKITTINASVTDSAGQTVATASWPCGAHSGTISNVPVGTVSVTVDCLVGGVVLWRGQATGITIVAGQTVNAGTVTMTYVGSDTTAPTVSSTTPANNATGVAVNTTVSAVFSEDVVSASVNTNTFILTCGTATVNGSVTYDSPARTATFTPGSALPAPSTCNSTITTGVEDLAGLPMAADYRWSFTISISGRLDTTFGTNGKVNSASFPSPGPGILYGLAIQPDGKIVVAGSNGNWMGVARYFPSGAIDTSFGIGGLVTVPTNSSAVARAVAVQTDGKIVVAGHSQIAGGISRFTLARGDSHGNADPSFGGVTAIVSTPVGTTGSNAAYSIGILPPTGDIVAGGEAAGNSANNAFDFALGIYSTLTGSLISSTTTSFFTCLNANCADRIQGVAIQADGMIVAAGFATGDGGEYMAVARYTSAGVPDTSFGTAGKVTFQTSGSTSCKAMSVALQPDGKIVVAGHCSMSSAPAGQKFAIQRLNKNGTPDASFNGGNVVLTTLVRGEFESINSIRIQPDGKIIAAGTADGTSAANTTFGLARYNIDGTLDTTFNSTGSKPGTLTTSMNGINDDIYAVGLQSDGKVVAAGGSFGGTGYSYALARYWNDVTTTKRVYTANVTNSLSIISTSTNTLAADASLITSPSFSINIGNIVVNPSTNRLYVSNSGGFGTSLFVVDTINNVLINTITITTGERGTGQLAIDTSRNRLYVNMFGVNSGSGGDGNTVAVIDTSDNTIVKMIPVGFGPRGIALDSASNRLYVVNSVTKNVSIIDTITNTVVGTIPPSGTFGTDLGGAAIDASKKKLYVTNFNTNNTPGEHKLFVIDLNTNSVTKTLTTGNNPTKAVVDPVASRVYVSNRGSNSVTIVDTTAETVLAGGPNNILVGNSPLSMALDLTGSIKMLYIANTGESTVSVIDVTNIVPRNPIPVSPGPSGIAIAP